jgi:hypothetical protein
MIFAMQQTITLIRRGTAQRASPATIVSGGENPTSRRKEKAVRAGRLSLSASRQTFFLQKSETLL